MTSTSFVDLPAAGRMAAAGTVLGGPLLVQTGRAALRLRRGTKLGSLVGRGRPPQRRAALDRKDRVVEAGSVMTTTPPLITHLEPAARELNGTLPTVAEEGVVV